MFKLVQKQKPAIRTASTKSTRHEEVSPPQTHVVFPIVHSQRAMGHQAVQRMFQLPDGTSKAARESRLGHNYDRLPFQLVQKTAQGNLSISDPGDKYEQEAQRVAHQVLRIPENVRADRSTKKFPFAHTSRSQTAGRPLSASEQNFFEPRFNRDFSTVRVHQNQNADAAARALRSSAFTLGTDIVFRSDAYNPSASKGQMLMAHELTHVLQQTHSNSPVSAYQEETGQMPTISHTPLARPQIQRQATSDATMGFWVRSRIFPELHYHDPYEEYYKATVLGPFTTNLVPPITLPELKEIFSILPRDEIQQMKKKNKGKFIGFIGVEEDIESYLPYICAAFKEFNIDTPERKAVYIAHMVQETSNLTHLEERPTDKDKKRYEDSSLLRNQGGIGAFHHTSIKELRLTAENLGLKDKHVLENTDLGADPEYAFRMGGEYFTRHGFHKIADSLKTIKDRDKERTFRKTTNKINPGETNARKRRRFGFYKKALAVLRKEPNHSIRQLQRDRLPYNQVDVLWPNLVDQYLGQPGALFLSGTPKASAKSSTLSLSPDLGINSFGPF